MPTAVSCSSVFGQISCRDVVEARLSRALSEGRDNHAEDSSTEVRSAARDFAAQCRGEGLAPEHMVIALKDVFRHLDRHTPMLSDPMMLEHKTHEQALCAEWYPELLTLCLETYFAAMW